MNKSHPAGDAKKPPPPAGVGDVSFLARPVTSLLIGLITLYRLFLSPLLGQNCRFQPTCSAYASEAILTHGPLRGTWLAIRRLSRCHPISFLGGSSGFDPVPPAHQKTRPSGPGTL